MKNIEETRLLIISGMNLIILIWEICGFRMMKLQRNNLFKSSVNVLYHNILMSFGHQDDVTTPPLEFFL